MTDAGRTRVEPGAVVTHSTLNTLARRGPHARERRRDRAHRSPHPRSSASSAPLLHNLAGGVIRKSAAAPAPPQLSVPVRNDGLVESASPACWSSSAAAPCRTPGPSRARSDSARVVLGAGLLSDIDHVLGAGVDLEGVVESAGNVQVADGVVQTVDDTLLLSSRTAASATSTSPGCCSWTGGDLTGPGTATIGPAGELLGDNGCGVSLEDGRRIVNDGLVRLVRGTSIFGFGDDAPRDRELRHAAPGRHRGRDVRRRRRDHRRACSCTTRHDREDRGPARDGSTARSTTTAPSPSRAATSPSAATRTVTHDGSFGASGTATLTFDDGTFVLGPAASLTGDAVIGFAELLVAGRPDAHGAGRQHAHARRRHPRAATATSRWRGPSPGATGPLKGSAPP